MSTDAEPPLPASQSPPSDVGRRYVRAAFHTGIGGVASRILTGFAPVVLARYLGPKEYGVYTLVLSLVGIVAGVSHLGQNKALQKFLPEYHVKNPARGGAILADTVVLVSGTLAVVCTIFFFFSGWIATSIYHQTSLTPVFQFSALLVLSLSLFNLALSAVAGLQDFKAYSKAMMLRSGGFLLLAWIGVWLLGLYGALGGQLLAAALGLGYLMVIGIRATGQRFPGTVKVLFSRAILAEIFSFAFPAFLAGMLVGPAYWWASTLLARHAGFEQVGLFGVAFAMSQLIMVIPGSLSIPGVSFMSETYASLDPSKFGKLVSANLRVIWALTLPISFGCAVFAPRIVRIVFGSAYVHAATLASVMSFVALLMALNSMVGNAIAGAGQMWHGLALNAIWAAIFLAAAAVLIPQWGGMGLVAAFGLSYLLLTIASCLYTKFYLRVNYDRLGLLAILTLASAGIAYLVFRSNGGTMEWSFASAVFFGLMGAELKWALDEKERKFFMGFLPRLGLARVREEI